MASSIINSDDGSVSGTTGLKTTGGDDGALEIQSVGTKYMTVAAGGDISFYEATGTTAKFFWDASAEGLAVGKSSLNTWASNYRPLQIGESGSLYSRSDTTEVLGIGSNFHYDGTSSKYLINGYASRMYQNSGIFAFENAASGTAGNTITFTERMRIDSSGYVGINRTDAAAPLSIYRSDTNRIIETTSYSTVAQNHFVFENNSGSAVGTINVSTTATAYNTSSDYRLKEDWQPMSGSIDRLKNLNPVNFAWKADGSRVDGFLAHEAAEVVPEAVTGEKDAVEAIGNVTDAEGTVVQENVLEPAELAEGQTWTKTEDRPVYQGIDQAKLVPLLTAALQEAVSKIEALETRIAALEA